MTVFLGETEIHVCTMYMYFNCFFSYSKLWYKIWNNVLQEDCTQINTLFNLPYSKCDYFVDSKMDLIPILPCKPGNYFYVALLADCYFHFSHPVMNSKISFIHAPTNFKTPGCVQVIIVINEMKLIFVLWLKQNVDGNTILTQNWELDLYKISAFRC